MDFSLISIIIPTYNRKNLIKTTIESVIKQTYENWECIIVDDGSDDGTEEFVEGCFSMEKRIKYFHRPANKLKGANACRNFGFQRSKGDFIIFLDSDDILDPECLKIRVETIKNNPNLDFVVFSMGVVTATNDLIVDDNRKVFYLDSKEEYLNQFLKGPLPWNMTRPIYRSGFFEKTSGFAEDLMLFQDDEFNIRTLTLHNPLFKIFDVTDCYYRIYENLPSKYEQLDFKNLIVQEYCKFRIKILKLLEESLCSSMRVVILKSLVSVIQAYSGSLASFRELRKIIFLYQRNGIISRLQEFDLLLLLLLNTSYRNKKGYFCIGRFLKKRLFHLEY